MFWQASLDKEMTNYNLIVSNEIKTSSQSYICSELFDPDLFQTILDGYQTDNACLSTGTDMNFCNSTWELLTED